MSNYITNTDIETLQTYLVQLNQTKKTLAAFQEQLQNMFHEIDKILAKFGDKWATHREKYLQALVDELATHKIILTEDEKNMLRYNGTTASSLATTLENLEKLKIKLPNKVSDFTIVAYDTIVAALSSTLHKPEELYPIIKKLQVIDQENDATNAIKIGCQKEFEQIIKTITELKNNSIASKGLSLEQEETIEKIEEAILTLEKQQQETNVEPLKKQATIN